MFPAKSFQVSTPNETEIRITRTFDAPRALVWDAMSKPEFLRRWLLGPPGWSLDECTNDLRAGGTYHWLWRGPDGAAMTMSGVYREVAAPERMIRTECFSFGCEAQAGEQLATLSLRETGSQTHLTLSVLYPNQEARDGALASGMERGVSAGYERLDELFQRA